MGLVVSPSLVVSSSSWPFYLFFPFLCIFTDPIPIRIGAYTFDSSFASFVPLIWFAMEHGLLLLAGRSELLPQARDLAIPRFHGRIGEFRDLDHPPTMATPPSHHHYTQFAKRLGAMNHENQLMLIEIQKLFAHWAMMLDQRFADQRTLFEKRSGDVDAAGEKRFLDNELVIEQHIVNSELCQDARVAAIEAVTDKLET